MPQVFGYGSLLSPASVSRTLGRPVALADLVPCAVAGYRRTWTARVPVWVGPHAEPADALFLDLSRSPGDTCNGILLTVTESGFDRIPLARRAKAFAENEGGWAAQMKLIEKYLAQAS